MLKLLSLSMVAIAVLLLSGEAGFAQQCDPDIDCIAAVPEPSALALMAAGLGALVVARFRKRR